MFHFLHSGGERIYYTFVVVSELKPFIDCPHGPLPGRRFQHCYRRFDVSCISGRLPQPYVVGTSCDSMPAHTCAPSSRSFGRLN